MMFRRCCSDPWWISPLVEMSETPLQYFLQIKLTSTQKAVGIYSPSISVQVMSTKMERGFCAVQILVFCGMTNKCLRCIGSGYHHCCWLTPDFYRAESRSSWMTAIYSSVNRALSQWTPTFIHLFSFNSGSCAYRAKHQDSWM